MKKRMKKQKEVHTSDGKGTPKSRRVKNDDVTQADGFSGDAYFCCYHGPDCGGRNYFQYICH